MFRQVLNSTVLKKNTKNILKQDIKLLCNRVSISNLIPRSLFHSNVNVQDEQRFGGANIQDQERIDRVDIQFSSAELLRKNAAVVQTGASLRGRSKWLKEEDERLLNLIEIHGKQWTYLLTHFVDRTPAGLANRYALLTNRPRYGPWTKEEVVILKELGRGRVPEDINNWEEIQTKLPLLRPLYLIKQKYAYSLSPLIKLGRWTEEENAKLTSLITRFGDQNWDKIASMIGTRTRRQCLERWRWQMSSKKGRFSPLEDVQILAAVEKYGENFAAVAKVIGTDRTPRNISQHYQYFLSPNADRSPWTPDEARKVYETCLKNDGDMLKTKAELKSDRAIRDLWNHYYQHKRFIKN